MSYIVTTVSGGTGHILLDRPKALNALTQQMVGDIDTALESWSDDDAVTRVLITSASPKAYCAGGDIRVVRDQVVAGEDFTAFFGAEYDMNLRLAEFSKPVIALIDGVDMGGGVGISVHGSHRVVSEKALFAMPETAIGFLPDVGSTHILARLPHRVGLLMGLTGARLGAGDALAVGLATHFCPSERMAELAEALLRGDDLEAALAAVADEKPAATLPFDEIERAFSGTARGAIAAVERASGAWAETARDQLRAACPTSVLATHAVVTQAARRTLPQCLAEEAVVGARLIRRPDFAEGVRAVLIDKDRDPKFSPATIADVDDAEIAALVG
ncbi:enoyl-CoA hydratase/isomerase family protein [Tsukamurella sp. 8F]|uniref:enoyl-CoA hydratase/isomerase family protein n=1 Tax=unclassified Tsukamurella TaxID=2633480 RepID=UPI0023B8D4B0|nr:MULTISPECIES: enoyl-CoA hydratase/isomerase family protein [unclassified Tsukamurella]MDF0530258.1 enoyl-CoA hydratase/isomerase family protein [Tsukamurella sp. 8J]MDF0586575.1 enoyl-CoA hydratase/isomerase family protein [Tsukamurella sp. 8F]